MTKIDKLNRSEIVKAEKTIRTTLNIPKEVKIYNFSSLKKLGKEELTDKLLEDIAEPLND